MVRDGRLAISETPSDELVPDPLVLVIPELLMTIRLFKSFFYCHGRLQRDPFPYSCTFTRPVLSEDDFKFAVQNSATYRSTKMNG